MRILYCFIFALCYLRADSVVNVETLRNIATKVSSHPLVSSVQRALSRFHNDNFIDIGENLKTQMWESVQVPQSYTSQPYVAKVYDKPKVLLIMDDLTSLEQIYKLEHLGLNITPSIFPRTRHNPTTPKLAEYLNKKGKSFMVHLPLEAQQFSQSELAPIRVGANKEAIKHALIGIKADFPHLVYLNNHTGSKFTQSYDDMRNLLEAFDELNLKFIDSVTTSTPVSERISMEQDRLIMARDVFLDNETHIAYIKAQIRSLITKAQNKDYAIAICHPNSGTFQALAQMSDEIKEEIELISPSDLETYLVANKTLRYVRAPFTRPN